MTSRAATATRALKGVTVTGGNYEGGGVPIAHSSHLHPMPSATGGIARLVWARLREAGIEADGLLSKVGLTRNLIEDRKARLSVESQIRFLALGAEALQDDDLGFHLARDFDLREIGLLYYVAGVFPDDQRSPGEGRTLLPPRQ